MKIRNHSNKIICLLSFVMLLFHLSIAHASDYYVSTTGSDSNPGTLQQPWRTVQKATNTLQAGDTAYIRGGTYMEYMIKFSNSGSAGSPITIKGYSGEMAIIDGGFTSPNGRQPVFDIDNVNYITLDGLTIKRGSTANIYIAYDFNATNVVIRNCDLQDFVANDNSAHVFIDDGADITIERNTMHGFLSSSGNAAGIIIFRTGNLTIKNNEIYSTYEGIYYKHSLDNGSTTLIENNLIYNLTGRWGILSSKKDAIIRNNVIYNVADTGIRVFEESATCDRLVSTNNQIIHNTIVDISIGIKLDRSTSCPGAVDTVVKDNLIYNFTTSEGQTIYPYYSSDTSNTTFDHNLIYSSSFSSPIRVLGNYYIITTIPSTVKGTGNIQQVPIFKDYANKDFTLLSGPGKNSASDGYDMGADTSLPPTPSDTQAPTVPTGLSAQAFSSSQINLSWTASTDNVGGSGVSGYRIFRDSAQIATPTTTSYSNTGLSASTTYTYTVSAIDAAGNESSQSSSASATTSSSGGGSDIGGNASSGGEASGGSGCGFVKDDGKGQGAKGEGLSLIIMLIITLTAVFVLRRATKINLI